MRNKLSILILCCLLAAGCATQKKPAEQTTKPKTETKKPSWHTCLIQGAKATIHTSGGTSVSATVTMQTVRDSLLIVNIMPALGIEVARLEATPTEILAFDKFNNRYAQTTYAELNKRLKPKISWKELQRICSAEVSGNSEKAHLVYSIGKDTIQFDIKYTPRKLNVPLKMNRLRSGKYKKMDINQWL